MPVSAFPIRYALLSSKHNLSKPIEFLTGGRACYFLSPVYLSAFLSSLYNLPCNNISFSYFSSQSLHSQHSSTLIYSGHYFVDISWGLAEPYSDSQSLPQTVLLLTFSVFFLRDTVSRMHLLLCYTWAGLLSLSLRLEVRDSHLEREACWIQCIPCHLLPKSGIMKGMCLFS